MNLVHATIDYTTAYVNDSILYNLETETSQWYKCKIIGLSCNKNVVPTFHILVDDKYMFSNVPPSFINLKSDIDMSYPLTDLIHKNCVDNEFSIHKFEHLSKSTSMVYIKSKDIYINAEYWFTIDFYNQDEWFHCMKLNNGQIAFLHSNKIVFNHSDSKDHKFPEFKKLCIRFKV